MEASNGVQARIGALERGMQSRETEADRLWAEVSGLGRDQAVAAADARNAEAAVNRVDRRVDGLEGKLDKLIARLGVAIATFLTLTISVVAMLLDNLTR